RETLLDRRHVDRDLEREPRSEPLDDAIGGRVTDLRRLLRPGMIGPHRLEDPARGQCTRREPACAVQKGSAFDQVGTLHDGCSLTNAMLPSNEKSHASRRRYFM